MEGVVAKRKNSRYEAWEAQRLMGKIPPQQRPGVGHRRVRAWRTRDRVYHLGLLTSPSALTQEPKEPNKK